MALNGKSAVDNANPHYFCEAAATPYVYYTKLTVGGTLKQHITWEYHPVAGSTLTNGTGVATGSPISLAYGNNTITVTQAGTFTATLATGIGGTATSGTATVSGSPQTLLPGNNTITVSGTGTFTLETYPLFLDKSGNNNHAKPSFRTTSSNGNVSAAATYFRPVSESKAPAQTLGETPPWLEDVPTISGNFTTTVTPTYPGADLVKALADASATPEQLPHNLIAGFFILALSVSTSAVLRRYGVFTLLVKGLLIGLLMGIAVAVHVYDFWMIIVFAFIGITLALISTDPRWG